MTCLFAQSSRCTEPVALFGTGSESVCSPCLLPLLQQLSTAASPPRLGLTSGLPPTPTPCPAPVWLMNTRTYFTAAFRRRFWRTVAKSFTYMTTKLILQPLLSEALLGRGATGYMAGRGRRYGMASSSPWPPTCRRFCSPGCSGWLRRCCGSGRRACALCSAGGCAAHLLGRLCAGHHIRKLRGEPSGLGRLQLLKTCRTRSPRLLARTPAPQGVGEEDACLNVFLGEHSVSGGNGCND